MLGGEKECVRVKERDDVDVCWGRERMCACVCVKEREKERERENLCDILSLPRAFRRRR